MRIVFLDIDGVLNNDEFFRAEGSLNQKVRNDRKLWWLEQLEARAVLLLNGLLERSGAKVVVSSSWRHVNDLDELRELLGERGFTGELIGLTPKRGGECRGDHIQLWLDGTHHEIESFVILDDSSDMGLLVDRLVQTTWQHGLQPEHVEAAVALLELPV